MKINFLKMHGLGNDFIMLDGVSQQLTISSEDVVRLSDRHLGIGCDQLLIVEPTLIEGVDFKYRIFNHDGSEVEQCGNGARCFAQFVRRQGLIDKDDIKVETLAGIFQLQILDDSLVKVEMGMPIFDYKEIPFVAPKKDLHEAVVNDHKVEFYVVSMGNPHAVIFVDDIDGVAVREIGRHLEQDVRFPNRANVQFVQVVNNNTIIQRIFERGAGETLASGSGACAAVAVGQKYKGLDAAVDVNMQGGKLNIYRDSKSKRLFMTGPTQISFEGSVEI